MPFLNRVSVGLFVLSLCLPLPTAHAARRQDGDTPAPKASRLRRLPPHFGKLKLKPAQIEEIYDIRESYGEKLNNLQAQLEKLRAQQTAEVEDVLTRTQQTALKKLQAGSSKPVTKTRAARSSSGKSTSKSTSKLTSKSTGKPTGNATTKKGTSKKAAPKNAAASNASAKKSSSASKKGSTAASEDDAE